MRDWDEQTGCAPAARLEPEGRLENSLPSSSPKPTQSRAQLSVRLYPGPTGQSFFTTALCKQPSAIGFCTPAFISMLGGVLGGLCAADVGSAGQFAGSLCDIELVFSVFFFYLSMLYTRGAAAVVIGRQTSVPSLRVEKLRCGRGTQTVTVRKRAQARC